MPKKAKKKKARILVIDIETRPIKAYCWGLRKENIGIDQVIESSEMICWSAKWLGESKMMFRSVYHDGKKKMLEDVFNLIDEAEAIVHYNGQAFDLPAIRTDLFINGYKKPPSPFKHIDLMKASKTEFRLPSYKLDFMLRLKKIGRKIKTDFELWIGCMNNDPKAWAKMKRYNMHDVRETAILYKEMAPWISKHPTLYAERDACPSCGSKHVQYRGSQIAVKWRWKRYQCQSCGKWYTGNRETF